MTYEINNKILFSAIVLAFGLFFQTCANAITIDNKCTLPLWGSETKFHIYNRGGKGGGRINQCNDWHGVKRGGKREDINAQGCFGNGWTEAYVEAEGTVVGAEFTKNSAYIECTMKGLICTCSTLRE